MISRLLISYFLSTQIIAFVGDLVDNLLVGIPINIPLNVNYTTAAFKIVLSDF